MTYLRHKSAGHGYALLALSLILLIVCGLITLYTANAWYNHQRIATDEYRQKQAFEAAQGGLDYGLAYLNANKSTIIKDTNSDGFIDPSPNPLLSSSMTNPLSTGSFSVTFSNPTNNNFQTILITSKGISQDGLVNHTVSQMVSVARTLFQAPTFTITALGNVTLQGSVNITNTINNKTMTSGGTTNLIGAANTTISTGTSSTSHGIKSDVTQNAYPGVTLDQFFNMFFNSTPQDVKSQMDTIYTNAASTNYSSLLDNSNPNRGNLVWIEQTGGTANIQGNITIGTTTSPVLLIVNGDLSMSGGATLNGLLYVTQSWINKGSGNVNINGGIIIGGDLTANGNPTVTYNTEILNNIQNLGPYTKVIGSWKDF